MNQLSKGGAFYPENINKIEEQNKSCDSAGGSFHSHKIFVPCNGHGRSEISTLMNSGQGGDNNTSLSQETNDIVRNSEILEDGKDVKIYHRRKRLKKADHSDFLRSDVESLHEVADSSLGDMCQIMDSSTLVKPIEFEDVSHCISLSMTEKRDTFEDGISAEVGEKCVNADMVVSDQLEERHDEAKDITDVADGDALGGIAPLYHEEQQCMASHADLSLTLVDGTQSVSSHVAHESMDVHVGRAFAGFKPKKLLVLDINGLLVDISSYVPYNYEPDDIIMKKAVFRRPHCDDFLNFCFERFNVGFWTSRTKRNMEPILDFLLGNSKSRLLFYWDQSHCTDTGFYTVEKRDKPLLLKKLKKLWDKRDPALPWERGVYNESNTLLVDDSPSKALSNPCYTAVFPRTYRFRDVRDNSLGPGGDLRVYLEGLAEAENVQEYVKQNPFGQRPITEKNLSWGYYRKVIEANSTPPRETDTNNP